MKFETLKDNKKILLATVIVFVVILTLIISTSLAKYKVTESINIARGTINYSLADFNMVAMYQINSNGSYDEINIMPNGGYVINESSSYCTINGVKDTNAVLKTIDGNHTIANLQKGSKCYLYFDKIVDGSAIILANKTISERTDFSTTLTTDTTGTMYSAEDDDGISYYFAGAPTDNWVKFAGFYWRIIRINGDGTIRLIYNGTTTNTTGTTTQLSSTSDFNSKYDDNAYVGYMYGERSSWIDGGRSSTTSSLSMSSSDKYYYGTKYLFDATKVRYTLSGTKTNDIWNENFVGYYTCKSTSDYGCHILYYINAYNSATSATVYKYMPSSTGGTTYETTHTNTNSSIIKEALDTWYTNNLVSYAQYIDKKTGFCGDRTAYTNEAGSSSGGGYGVTETYYGAYIRLITNKAPSLKCINSNDLYTTSDSTIGNKALTYPVGLITADELAYAGAVYKTDNTNYYLYTGQYYWTMTPKYTSYFAPYVNSAVFFEHAEAFYYDYYLTADDLGVRPVINLRADVELSGNGTTEYPYEVVM